MKKIAMISMVPIVAFATAACNNGEPELGKAQSGVESASALASETSTTAHATSTKTSPPPVMSEDGPGEVSVEVDGNVIDEQFTPVVCFPEGPTLKLEGGVEHSAQIHANVEGADDAPTLGQLTIKTHTLNVHIDERTREQTLVTKEGDAWVIDGQGMHEGHANAELPATVKVRIVCPGGTGGVDAPADDAPIEEAPQG